MQVNSSMRGKLIVIEGADASGKKTQSKLLFEKIRQQGKAAELVSFPRYEAFCGSLVKKYLNGEFGSLKVVPPEFAALLYALDRYDATRGIECALQQGSIVVADRFTASNIAHQAAKFSGAEQQRFIKWIECLESRLPKPSLTFYLDVPVSVSQGLMQAEGRQKDLHEENAAYLEKVRVVYLWLAKQRGWVKINCVKGGKLLSVEQIHSLIWKKAKALL